LKPHVLSNLFLKPLLYGFANISLFILGWKTRGKMPDLKKFILVAAPHSSNWDFVFFLLVIFKFQIPVSWMGKKSMFIWPFKGTLERLGGIPIDRAKKGNLVAEMVKIIKMSDHMIVTIAPSGTRQKVNKWKTGFYHIASQADIPIACGFIDYNKKHCGIGPVFFPTRDMDDDMRKIKEFYKDKFRKYT